MTFDWTIPAYLLISVVSGVLTCGLIFALGGLGVINRRLNGLENVTTELEGKTLRLNKKMASEASVVARQGKIDNNQLLFELQAMKNQNTDDRPSVVRGRVG